MLLYYVIIKWTVVESREHNIEVTGDFYMVDIQTQPNPLAPGLATDETSTNAKRSYQLRFRSMVTCTSRRRKLHVFGARVSYEVHCTCYHFTSQQNLVTNKKMLRVEGTASPTTTIQLKT